MYRLLISISSNALYKKSIFINTSQTMVWMNENLYGQKDPFHCLAFEH